MSTVPDRSKTAPDRLLGTSLEAWRWGAAQECIVSEERAKEIFARHPEETGRPGILIDANWLRAGYKAGDKAAYGRYVCEVR